jgi:hypothetical protein
MDKQGIYFNNVYNVLVQGSKEYPMVRKWGYLWLLIDELEKNITWYHIMETELR